LLLRRRQEGRHGEDQALCRDAADAGDVRGHRPSPEAGHRQRQRLLRRRRQRAPDGLRPHHRQGKRDLPSGRPHGRLLRRRLRHVVSRGPRRQEARQGNLVRQPEDDGGAGEGDRAHHPRGPRRRVEGAHPRLRARGGGTRRAPARLDQGRVQRPPRRRLGPVSGHARPAPVAISRLGRGGGAEGELRGKAQAGRRQIRSLTEIAMRPFLTLHDPTRAAGWYEAGLWTRDTFYSLMADHAARRPDAAALRDGHETLTWAELKARVDALAAEFEELGLVAGDRVSLWLSNRLHAHVVFLACARIGIACNPSLHRTYTCGEIVELVTRLESAAFVTEKGWGADRDSHDL